MRRIVLAITLFCTVNCGNEITVPDVTPDSSGTPSTEQVGLWTVSGSASAILRLDPGQLSDTSAREGIVVTTSSANLNTLAAIAFDAAGTLWVIGQDEPILLALDRDALTSSGSKLAHRTIVPGAGSLRSPTGLAFDSQQRLWVADFAGTLNRFDVEQLASGGVQQPSVVVNVRGNPLSIAFDADGSLWASDNIHNVIRKYTPAQLATSGLPEPEVELSARDLSLANPAGLAFDSYGNLWVANIGGRTLVSFDPAKLGRTGSPAPNVVITSDGGSLSVPVALAFDADENLWVMGGTGALTRFSQASLGASGPAVPALRTQVASRSLFWNIAFWPVPDGLPLGQRSSRAISSTNQ